MKVKSYFCPHSFPSSVLMDFVSHFWVKIFFTNFFQKFFHKLYTNRRVLTSLLRNCYWFRLKLKNKKVMAILVSLECSNLYFCATVTFLIFNFLRICFHIRHQLVETRRMSYNLSEKNSKNFSSSDP